MSDKNICYNCKHSGNQFKVGDLTHVHCEHPDEEIAGEPGWGTLREWYNKYPCFEPKTNQIDEG